MSTITISAPITIPTPTIVLDHQLQTIPKLQRARHQELGHALLNAAYNINKMESRILHAIVGLFEGIQKDTGVILVRSRDIIRESGIRAQTGHSTHSYLFDVISSLLGKEIQLYKDRKLQEPTKIFKSATYYKKHDVWEIRLGEWFRAVGDKSKGFVPMNLEKLRKFPTKYAARLLNLIHGAQNSYTLNFQTIRSKFELPQSYEKNYNVIKRVIEPAVNAINLSGIVSVTFKVMQGIFEDKNGNTKKCNTGIYFEVLDEERRKKEEALQHQIDLANQQFMSESGEDCALNHLAYLKHRKISFKDVISLKNRYDVHYSDIIAFLVLTEKRVVKNPLGYINGMLKNKAQGYNILRSYKAQGVDATLNSGFQADTEDKCRYAIVIASVIASLTEDDMERRTYQGKMQALYSYLRDITGNPNIFCEYHCYFC